MLDFFASAELMREVDAFSCISRLKIETDLSSGSRPQGPSTWRQYSQAKPGDRCLPRARSTEAAARLRRIRIMLFDRIGN